MREWEGGGAFLCVDEGALQQHRLHWATVQRRFLTHCDYQITGCSQMHRKRG